MRITVDPKYTIQFESTLIILMMWISILFLETFHVHIYIYLFMYDFYCLRFLSVNYFVFLCEVL